MPCFLAEATNQHLVSKITLTKLFTPGVVHCRGLKRGIYATCYAPLFCKIVEERNIRFNLIYSKSKLLTAFIRFSRHDTLEYPMSREGYTCSCTCLAAFIYTMGKSLTG